MLPYPGTVNFDSTARKSRAVIKEHLMHVNNYQPTIALFALSLDHNCVYMHIQYAALQTLSGKCVTLASPAAYVFSRIYIFIFGVN